MAEPDFQKLDALVGELVGGIGASMSAATPVLSRAGEGLYLL